MSHPALRRRRNPEDRGHVRDLLDRLKEFTDNVMEAAGDDPYETTFDPMEYPIDDTTMQAYLDAPVLGWGATRVVVLLPSGNVAKLPWSDMTQASTDNEWDRWQAASDEVREMLLPPLEYVGGGIGVIVFPFVRTAEAAGLDYDHPWLVEAREKWKALWLAGAPGAEAEDYQNTQNWGVYTDPDTGTKRVVLIDYGD
jgi:hypothetical protein